MVAGKGESSLRSHTRTFCSPFCRLSCLRAFLASLFVLGTLFPASANDFTCPSSLSQPSSPGGGIVPALAVGSRAHPKHHPSAPSACSQSQSLHAPLQHTSGGSEVAGGGLSACAQSRPQTSRNAPRTVREYTAVVLSHPICGHLLQQPQGTHMSLGSSVNSLQQEEGGGQGLWARRGS